MAIIEKNTQGSPKKKVKGNKCVEVKEVQDREQKAGEMSTMSLKRKKRRRPSNKMILDAELLAEQKRRFERRNQRCLFVTLPKHHKVKTMEELKSIFANCLQVRLQHFQQYGNCYVEYESAKMAEQMKKALDIKEIHGGKLKVEFRGNKAKSGNLGLPKVYCRNTLVVDSLPGNTSVEELGTIFHTATSIKKKLSDDKSVFLVYNSQEAAVEAFKEHGNLKIKDQEVLVAFTGSVRRMRGKAKKLKTIKVGDIIGKAGDKNAKDTGKNEDDDEDENEENEDEEDE